MALKIEVPVVVTPVPSNMAIMREALEKAELGLFRWMSGTMNRDEHRELVATIKEALAEPARNCDVGTAEEQSEAFYYFCGSHWLCSRCPLRKRSGEAKCLAVWLQMPYEDVWRKMVQQRRDAAKLEDSPLQTEKTKQGR